jgi:RNA polymerase sigma factor (sigma-70 family)
VTSDRADDRTTLLLREGAALRALARCLVGSADAEDLVQDTRVAALTAPHGSDGFLAAWLRATLRNLGLAARRGTARRRGRERDAAERGAAGARDVASDPAALAAQAELVRDVGAAVHALDEPFRTAVLLRFWHGLTPDGIAAHLGVPRNTVRSRLQRGLERLRATLDARHGTGSWRAGLALVAAPRAAPLAAAPAAAFVGWLMHGKLLTTLAAALAVAVAGAWLWRAQPARPAAPVAERGAAAMIASASVPSAPPQATVVREPASAPDVAAAPAPFHVRWHGRCVDEHGAPLAGALVVLEADVQLLLPFAERRREAASGPDGTFALEQLPAAASYRLTASAPDRVPVGVAWAHVEPGRSYALGDLVLAPGGGVRGRVVDTNGAARAGVPVRVLRTVAAPADGELRQAGTADFTTGADGTFASAGALAPGPWTALVLSPYVASDPGARRELTIEVGRVTADIELVVPAAGASLRLRVVDEAGAGVERAVVRRAEQGLLVQPPMTGADGWVEFQRVRGDASETVTLIVQAPGRQRATTTPLPWGHVGTFVLAAGPTTRVELRARDGHAPVDTFGLRLVPAVDTAEAGYGRLPVALPLLRRPDGVATLPGLEPGRYVVWVELDDARFASFRSELVASGPQPHCTILVPPRGTRRVRVVDASERPLAGSVVELVATTKAGPVPPTAQALSPRAFAGFEALLLLQRATTNAAGEVELAAAEDVVGTVRALGPGHRPLAVADVRFTPGLPALTLTPEVGGTIAGTFGPADLLARLGPSPEERHTASLGDERFGAMLPAWRVTVFLRPVGGGPTHPERAADGAVQDDGSFRIDGVPPGDWDVFVRHRLQGLARSVMSKVETRLAAVRGLASGERREVDLDGTALRPGTLHALVLVDGSPHANGEARLVCRRAGVVFGETPIAETQVNVRLDAEGRIAAELPPGTWAVEAHVAGGHGPAKLRNEQAVELLPGATVGATFALARRTLRVRVLLPDGSPAAARRFSVMQPGTIASAGTTDADGWLELESVPAGEFDLTTWPPELADPKAQTDYIRAHPYPQWLDALLRVGPLRMESGAVRAEQELRLPR